MRLAWVTVLAFLRITTHPRAFENPLAMDEAAALVDEWLALPAVGILAPGERCWAILRRLLPEAQVRGPLVMDAYLAALALEHGATLCTADRDFLRFDGLRLLNPLAGGDRGPDSPSSRLPCNCRDRQPRKPWSLRYTPPAIEDTLIRRRTGETRRMVSEPLFFLSYSRANAEGGWVDKFFGDLCREVGDLTGISRPQVGFMDDRSIPVGARWTVALGEALRSCRAFVPLYSPDFFQSEYCGKEWRAFESRCRAHSRGESAPPNLIVPALWVPPKDHWIPPHCRTIQYKTAEFGEHYPIEGSCGGRPGPARRHALSQEPPGTAPQ